MAYIDPEQLAVWAGGVWDPCAPSVISGVSHNTRVIKPGNLYIAITGEQFDGHTFVGDAFVKGASGAMIAKSSTLASNADTPLLRVENTVRSLHALARAYRMHVDPLVVGITGSVGKTTVKEMTAAILADCMATAKTQGNWNNEIGLPLSLLGMGPEDRAGVFELGMNHPGEIECLCQILQPRWGVVTSIGPVHIEFFESVDAIATEKASLLRSLPDDGCAVLCCDDPYFELLRKHVHCELLTVSLEGQGDYQIEFQNESGSLIITEVATETKQRLQWSWPGAHNALNAGYAVAVARSMGIDWESVVSGLEGYQPLPMRWEQTEAHGIRIINDAYNANPLSMRAAIHTFEGLPASGAKWLVLGDMLELGTHAESEHVTLGAYVARGPWDGVVVEGQFSAAIARGAIEAGFPQNNLFQCGDNAEVVSLLQAKMEAGGAVLLKASRGVALEEVVHGLTGM